MTPRRGLEVLALGAAVLLSACASPAPRPPAATPGQAGGSALDRLERLTLAANRCWIRSKDPTFARYSVAPELSSFSGRPRFLLVPRGRPEERPLLVVEGQPDAREVSVYGPLLDGSLGLRILSDIDRWSGGDEGCVA